MVFNILRQSQMIRVVVQFNADTDIEPKLKTAREYNKLLKDIPLKQLLDAMTFEQISAAVKKIFSQLKRARQIGSYPLPRALDLASYIARDFDDQVKKMLADSDLLRIDYADEFRKLQKELADLQVDWEAAVKDFKACVSTKLVGSINMQNQKYEQQINAIADDPFFRRLNAVAHFRAEHYKLE